MAVCTCGGGWCNVTLQDAIVTSYPNMLRCVLYLMGDDLGERADLQEFGDWTDDADG